MATESPPQFPAVRTTDIGGTDPSFLFDLLGEVPGDNIDAYDLPDVFDQMADLVTDDALSEELLGTLDDDAVMQAMEPRDQFEALALAGGMPEPLGITPVLGDVPTGPRISEFVNRGMTRFLQGRANQASARIEARVKHAEREQSLAQEVLQDMSSTRRTAKLETLRTMLNKSGRGSIADALPMMFRALEINKETGTAVAGMYGIADDPLVRTLIESYESRGGDKGPMREMVVSRGPMKGTYTVPEGDAFNKAVSLMRTEMIGDRAKEKADNADWMVSSRSGYQKDVSAAVAGFQARVSVGRQALTADDAEGEEFDQFEAITIPRLERNLNRELDEIFDRWERIDQERRGLIEREPAPGPVDHPIYGGGSGRQPSSRKKKGTKRSTEPTPADPMNLRGHFGDDADR